MKAIINGRIILPDEIIENHILIFDENIRGIVTELPDAVEEVIDINGKYIAPGFIDIHIHGTNGSDVMDGQVDSLKNISKSLLKNGVTTFLATTMTMGKTDIKAAFESVKNYPSTAHEGARLAGIHVEGPFINKAYKGAQNESYIITPEYELIKDYVELIKLITVAPEVPGMLDFVDMIKSKHPHIQFSIGHSAATYEEAVEGYEHGIASTTHLFNGMTGLHHRKPGIVGAVFKKKPYFEVIADQIHLHTAIYDIVGDAVGIDRMILITDAMCACQMVPGIYELGSQKVIVDETSARLESGALAGSILRMHHAVKNVFEHTHYSLSEVVNMATRNPANLLDIQDAGTIKIGKRADLVVLDDAFEIEMTLVNGKTLYERGL